MNARSNDLCSEKVPFVNVTNDGEAYPKRWIAALVQMNCEKKVATQLSKIGYETYIATQEEIHHWSDRRKKIDRLVIPMVIFIRATAKEEEWLRDQSYIHKLLAMPGSEEYKKKFATPIPNKQIEQLQFLLNNAESEVTIVDDLQIGDTVRISSGPLRGIEGMISEMDEKNSIIGVRIDGLGYACVRVGKQHLSYNK
ncbi:MAG: UpxY family transcription antiterminator [Candidatus Cryptobacteroides sp.]